jgi:hypothetical protein
MQLSAGKKMYQARVSNVLSALYVLSAMNRPQRPYNFREKCKQIDEDNFITIVIKEEDAFKGNDLTRCKLSQYISQLLHSFSP